MHPIIYSMVYTVFCTYKLGMKFPFFFFFFLNVKMDEQFPSSGHVIREREGYQFGPGPAEQGSAAEQSAPL